MPLDDAGLLAALQALLSQPNDAAAAAAGLQEAIATYVKSATVVPSGMLDSVSGPVTGSGELQ